MAINTKGSTILKSNLFITGSTEADGDSSSLIYSSDLGASVVLPTRNTSLFVIWWAKNTVPWDGPGGPYGGPGEFQPDIDYTVMSLGPHAPGRNSIAIGKNNSDIKVEIWNNRFFGNIDDPIRKKTLEYPGLWDTHFNDGEWHMYSFSILESQDSGGGWAEFFEFCVDGVHIPAEVVDGIPLFQNIFPNIDFTRGILPSSSHLFIGSPYGIPGVGRMNMQLYGVIMGEGWASESEINAAAYNNGDPTIWPTSQAAGDSIFEADIPGVWGAYAESWLMPAHDSTNMLRDWLSTDSSPKYWTNFSGPPESGLDLDLGFGPRNIRQDDAPDWTDYNGLGPNG